MQKLVKALPLAALLLLACEDGPNQTYSPSTPGAGDKWNNGNTPGAVDPSKQGYGQTSHGGQTKADICAPDVLHDVWGKAFKLPIVPPVKGAGIDISGINWNGLTIDQAEQGANPSSNGAAVQCVDGSGDIKCLCQSSNYGDAFGDGTEVDYWGDQGQVWADYIVSTRKIDFMTFWPGYDGKITATTHDGKSTFVIGPDYSQQIAKNGEPYTVDWVDKDAFNASVNEIYDAMLATFAPGLPPDPDCLGSGACITGNFGDVGYFGFGALGTFFWVDNYHAPQPTPSLITRVDMYLTKTLPFSLANPMLKIDAVGPTALAGLLGKAPAPCNVQLGLTYQDFLNDCVTVTGDSSKDQTELNKLLGGIQHGNERFYFDVTGVDLNFVDLGLAPDKIVSDKDRPGPGDVSANFDVDQSTIGRIANDYQNNQPAAQNVVKDLHGAGLVYMEYARLVQDGLSSYLPPNQRHPLGDPACLAPAVDPTALNFPAGCTGFEGFVTAAPGPTGDANMDKLALGQIVTLPDGKMGPIAVAVDKGLRLGMKPGHPQASFCLDATGDLTQSKGGAMKNAYLKCQAPAGAQGDIFATSFARALQVFGHGKTANMPADVKDVRFFWKQYVRALVKYFKVAGTANETVAGVHNVVFDENNLFFDSIGAGQFESGEYVERAFASPAHPPLDLRITADVKDGIFDDFTFDGYLYRGERTIYTAMLENQSDGLGQENNALLTNVFGSPLLKSDWKASSQGQSAYYCATNDDPTNCDNQRPPLDANGNVELDNLGNPILTPYQGAFGSTEFSLGPTPISITRTYSDIQQAMVSVPLTFDPYDAKSKKLPSSPYPVLVSWAPKQPGVGFPIAISGTLDKFVETGQLDFGGVTISANVDYDAVIDPMTHMPMANGSIQFLAVETSDFLGDVFVCHDKTTNSVLHSKMYKPVEEILDWLAAHPTAYDDCGIIITYSPYNNFADYITSLNSGVRLNITQGGGFGRVVDATLFVPGQ